MKKQSSLNVIINDLKKACSPTSLPENLTIDQLFTFLSFSIESAADEVFWMRDDSEIFYVNNAACEKLGYTRDEIIGMKVWEWDPLFPKNVWPTFWAEMRKKRNVEFETLHQKKSGEIFPVKIHGHYFVKNDEEMLFAFVNDISSEKQQEKFKRDTLLSNLTAVSDTSMAMTDENNRVLWVNESYQTLFGYSSQELEGEVQADYITGQETSSDVSRRIDLAIKRKQAVFEELKLYTKDNQSFWANLLIAPVIENDEANSFIYIINDISESKQSHEDLSIANRKLKLITEGSQDGFWHWVDVDGDLVEWTDKTYQLFGYEPNEFKSNLDNYQKMIHPDDLGLVRTAIGNAIELKVPYDIKYRVKKKSGHYSWFRDRGTPFHDRNGNLLEMAGSISNIDEIMLYQQSLNDANLKLRESIKSGRVGIWDWDIKRDTLIWDDLMYRIYGREQEGEGTFALWENAVHPDDKKVATEAIEQALAGIKDYRLEFRITLPSGETRYIKGDGTVIRDEKGNPVRMLGTNVDITEQKNIEEELRQAQKMEAVGQLAGGIAHDFNNSLASILGYTELLKSHIDDPALVNYIEKIIAGVEASSNLTKQLLTFSRKNQLTMDVLDVHALIADTVEILSHSIDKRIVIELELSAGHHCVYGDKTLLQNALINLCINARDAMLDGGVLTISSEGCNIDETSGIKITVSDTGVGISEEQQRKIFEPFYTTKDIGSGTGLGLASVYSTVSQLNGDIWVNSQVGSGTSFEMVFPLADKVEQEQQQANVNNHAHQPVASQTILLVEDEQAIRELCEEYLTILGHKTILATNGKEAVECYQQRASNIDIVIMDIMMPLMSGKDALTAIKNINSNAKVIIASGYAADFSNESLVSSGAIGVLSKPYRLDELKEAIELAI
ncbi:MAG: PAS domain S-box protein [Kangiellaceae bacterium]|jgi:PAS domain S-box-containing protein|nr:PAS domain S-box protein [Kangiellaceae bacterium]